MKNKLLGAKNKLVLLSSLFLINACNTYKNVPANDKLYDGAKVNVNPESKQKIEDEKYIKAQLETKTRPKPNTKILGIRYKLAAYNLSKPTEKKKGFNYWLRNKIGEPPVLASSVNIEQNEDVLSSYLISKGYLQATVHGDTTTKGKMAKAIYDAETGERYHINDYTFPATGSRIGSDINNTRGESIIKKGDAYDLDVYKSERSRIDNDLKNKGYYYFSPDNLIFKVDSTIGNHMVNVDLRIKENTPVSAIKPYVMDSIKIYPTYSLQNAGRITNIPTIYNDLLIYDAKNTYNSKMFERLIFFKKDKLYSREDHNTSLKRLVNLGVFSYVRSDIKPEDSTSNNKLNASFYLTPLKRNSLTFNVAGTQKSNNFVGSEINIQNTTRNVFHGGEILNVRVGAGFETQLDSGRAKNYSLTAEGKLSFPRFIVPFWEPRSTSAFVPRTTILLSYQRLYRSKFINLNSAKAEYGYNWKENIYKEHTLTPVSITYVRPGKETDSLRKLKELIPSIRNTYDSLFIIGSNYTFSYNNQIDAKRRNNYMFWGNVEVAGNVLGAVLGQNENGHKTLFNTPLTQFIRLETDVRDYFKINRSLTWASRINLGYGYAYGNHVQLPYVRQFFAGGSNDIRAFAARALGPGSYEIPNNQKFADQGGDIKIMFNTELRQKLVSILEGAAFVDAGNIWTRKEDPYRPGSAFKFKNAFNEMAVGGGLGLRVDAKIFIVRVDAAFPFRKPWYPEGKRWVFDEINISDKNWRRENLIVNIGIGYPF